MLTRINSILDRLMQQKEEAKCMQEMDDITRQIDALFKCI